MVHYLGAGWVRFTFEDAVEPKVYLVGDFNGWNEMAHEMEAHGDGTHQTILRLTPGEYEFKYKCGCAWFNERAADKYVPNCWGSENSVVVVPPYTAEELGDAIQDDRGLEENEPPGIQIHPGM